MNGQKASWNDFVCSVMIEWARAALVLPPPLVSESSSEEPEPQNPDSETDDQREGVDAHRFIVEWQGAMMALLSSHRRGLHQRPSFMRVPGNGLTAEFVDILQDIRSEEESVRTTPLEPSLHRLTALLCNRGMHRLVRRTRRSNAFVSEDMELVATTLYGNH